MGETRSEVLRFAQEAGEPLLTPYDSLGVQRTDDDESLHLQTVRGGDNVLLPSKMPQRVLAGYCLVDRRPRTWMVNPYITGSTATPRKQTEVIILCQISKDMEA